MIRYHRNKNHTIVCKCKWNPVVRGFFFTRCQIWPSGIVVLYVCVCLWLSVCLLCVCVCVNHKFVHTITHHPFKPGSPNLDQECKQLGWDPFRIVLEGDWPWPTNLTQSQILPKSELQVCSRNKSSPVQAKITKFGPKSQTLWLRSLLFWGVVGLDFQGQI